MTMAGVYQSGTRSKWKRHDYELLDFTFRHSAVGDGSGRGCSRGGGAASSLEKLRGVESKTNSADGRAIGLGSQPGGRGVPQGGSEWRLDAGAWDVRECPKPVVVSQYE